MKRTPEEALRESEARFRNAFEYAGTGMCLVALDGRFLKVNRVFCAMLGYTETELLGKRFGEITHPDDLAAGLEAAKRMSEGEIDSFQTEKRYLRKDGRVIWTALSTSLLRTGDGHPLYFVSQVQDIDRRHQAEDALRESEESFRSAFDFSNTGMVLVQPDGRFLRANRSFCQMLGMTEEELLGKTLPEVTHPEDVAESKLLLDRIRSGDRDSGEIVSRYQHRDGREVWGQVAVSLVRDASGRPLRLVAHVQDITRRRHAEEALRTSEKTYRLLFENNPNPMWVYDADSLGFLAVNEAAVAQYGYARGEFRAMSVRQIHSAPDEPDFLRHLAGRKPDLTFHGEWRHLRKDGSLVVAEVTTHDIRFEGRPAVLALLRDVTERRKAEDALRRSEEQLQQARKMEAIGRLAGGIAHDFNNLLTVILGYTQMLLKRHPAPGRDRSDLEEIRAGAMRGSSLTQQLLAFSRRQPLQPRIVNLNTLVSGMDAMIRRLIGENIELVADLASDLGRVKADPGQLEQVILNLAVNARDAMPNGGRLSIQTRNALLDTDPSVYCVLLTVTDSGTGIDPAAMAHLFEPFFTTKEQGKGTGLGLATVYGVVQQSGGHIRVSSDPGTGTVFRIYLPLVKEESTGIFRAAEVPRAAPAAATILLVEDEAQVRMLAARILRETGYTVLEASNGAEALRVIDATPDPVHLIVTDVVMPQMNGPDMARELARRRPEARVLFISGYADTSSVRAGSLPRGAVVLEKPFTEEALTARVRELLEAKR